MPKGNYLLKIFAVSLRKSLASNGTLFIFRYLDLLPHATYWRFFIHVWHDHEVIMITTGVFAVYLSQAQPGKSDFHKIKKRSLEKLRQID
ncbi:hypothetical protein A4R26_15865 [Niastella populi]|uniref:Uncharacterized protein n=1 Tax=Niastella populi TaxID=550983 RepID=A0A1V9G1Z9_9BACT|nr:hypothetical protein A4R26_15865 [Niastella populi]